MTKYAVSSMPLAGESACPTSGTDASVCQPGDLSGFFRAPHGGGPVAFALVLAAMLLAPACGYHVRGHAVLIPDTVHTISVSAFGNSTVRNTLARLLPADITREFHTRTRYTIVSDPAQADAVLTGAL